MEIRKTVCIIGQEDFLSVQVLFDGHKPLANIGVDSRIDKRYLPVVDIAVEKLQFLPPLGEHKIVGQTFVVIEEKLLDGLTLVAEAQNELFMIVVSVILHDMP
jgi:hypothetical protein